MATHLSWRHIELILNGHRFQGWSDDDPPVEFPDIDLVNVVTGKDGAAYYSDTGMLGGEVTIKLLPTSESAKRCLRWLEERDSGARLEFEGTYGDSEIGFSAALRGGALRTCRPATVPDQNFEVVFHFEEIIPDYDAAQFSPAPAVTAA